MVEKKYIRWMNEEIDGILTPDSKKKLDAYLSQNPEARDFHRHLLGTAGLLDDIENVEPTPGLKASVLKAIDNHRYVEKERPSVRKPLITIPSLRIQPRYAFAVLFGLVIGFLIPMIFNVHSPEKFLIDRQDFVGTVGLHESKKFHRVYRSRIDSQGITGVLILSEFDQLLGYEVNLRSENDFELIFKFDPGLIRFYGFAPHESDRVVLEDGGDYLKLRTSEDMRSVCFFQRISSDVIPFEIIINQSGVVLYRQFKAIEASEES